MRAYELLEYIQYDNQKFLSRWNSEGRPYEDQIGSEGENFISWLEQFDPTQKKKYINWMISKYLKGGISRLENIVSILNDYLERYERLSRKNKLNPEHKDINQFKTLSDFSDAVDQYKDEDASSQKEITQLTNKNIEVVYDGPDYIIQIPKTFESSKLLGKDTNWCTAYPDQYKKYSTQGDLYIIEHKLSGNKWEFHFESREYVNEWDEDINIDSFIKQHKKAAHAIIQHFGGLKEVAIADPSTWFRYIKNPSPELQMVVIKQDIWVIKFIKNPSPEIQMVVVKERGLLIKFIKNPSPEIQLVAVKQDGFAIEYIEDPSPEIQLSAIKKQGLAIEYIEDPSPELQLIAVKHDGRAIKFIKHPSPEIQLDAVKQDGRVIKFIKHPSPEIQLDAVKENGDAIKYIKNPTPEVKHYMRS